MKFKKGDKKSKRKTGNRSDDNGVREARDDGVDLCMGTSDGARWRSLACGRMTFEFWTLVLNYRRRHRRRRQSDVDVTATCIILNLQFFATSV